MAVEVLLVEDSKTQAAQIKETLESVGLTVRLAYDGPEGLREAVENTPSLIILDVKLPTMDGFQVCRRLKRNPQTENIPVIMLTEKADRKRRCPVYEPEQMTIFRKTSLHPNT